MYDEEYGDEEDWDEDPIYPDDDEETTMPCPHCRAEIFDDLDVCPQCGMAIIHSRNPWQGKPAWWIVFGFLGIIAVIVLLLGLPL